MMTEEGFEMMFETAGGNYVNWTDDEIEEFLHVMSHKGWVVTA